ncbi:uncharacterized protein ALTATR162_LOCUS9708 [Alternaria atra]|uniref:Uncharacterized protein n=1 Tax=Alternaria atra TaxID=119953 RepID=A0A8J2N944_9PLEO|nr:uncharacterized protein ALTATR162_LOCUS9708 [Alternaria atra]CAG5181329.1 unnamed protein product [Alternaria atra]
MNLTFRPRLPLCGSRKRSRAVADIDGEHSCVQKKKRRLRLFLITSRLSPQFSHPATNIVDRGSSKIAVWAKQKALGRNLLRKAAILNGVRRRLILTKEAQSGHGRVPVEQEREQAQLELARLEFNHGSVDTYTRPVLSRDPSVPPSVAVRTGGHFVVSGSPTNSPPSSRSPSPTSSSPTTRNSPEETAAFRSPNEAWSYSARDTTPRRDYLPLPPSPLGMSNYDALDVDGDAFDPYAHLDDEDEPIPNPYDEDDDDVPFSPSAVTTSSSTTLHTGTTNATMFSDLNTLDHSEPVFGDYDQVEDGAYAVWPSVSTQDSPTPTSTSTSLDVSALFATCLVAPKRADSFVMSPNFRPRIPTKSVSPEMLAVTTTTATSPNFTPTILPTTSASPNFIPTAVPMSPNFPPISTSPNFALPTATTSMSPNLTPLAAPASPNFLPISKSPNFTAQDTMMPAQNPSAWKHTDTNSTEAGGSVHTSDVEEERTRQRNLMFMRFGS